MSLRNFNPVHASINDLDPVLTVEDQKAWGKRVILAKKALNRRVELAQLLNGPTSDVFAILQIDALERIAERIARGLGDVENVMEHVIDQLRLYRQ